MSLPLVEFKCVGTREIAFQTGKGSEQRHEIENVCDVFG